MALPTPTSSNGLASMERTLNPTTFHKEKNLELKRLDPTRKSSEKEREVVLPLWRDFFGHDLSQPDPNDAGSAAVPPEKAGQPAPQIKTPKSKLKNPDVPPIPRETIAE